MPPPAICTSPRCSSRRRGGCSATTAFAAWPPSSAATGSTSAGSRSTTASTAGGSRRSTTSCGGRCSRSRSASSSTWSQTTGRSSIFSTPSTRSSTRAWPGTTACPSRDVGTDEWVRVDDAERYGRGGLLPMAVFLTKNSPGLRTSPVKRGYWVVRPGARRAHPGTAAECPRAAERRGQARRADAAAECWRGTAPIRTAPAATSGSTRSDWSIEGYGPDRRRREQGPRRPARRDPGDVSRRRRGHGLDGLRR